VNSVFLNVFVGFLVQDMYIRFKMWMNLYERVSFLNFFQFYT